MNNSSREALDLLRVEMESQHLRGGLRHQRSWLILRINQGMGHQ